MQLGRYGKNAGSNDLEHLAGGQDLGRSKTTKPTSPTAISQARRRGRRDTGKMKRYWGAYGQSPTSSMGNYDPKAPPAQQFRNPVHCVERSNDVSVYVCDRQGDRVRYSVRTASSVKEGFYAKENARLGFGLGQSRSRGSRARFMFLARPEREVASYSRDAGGDFELRRRRRQPGQFYGVHSIASDSKGNLYTTETYEGSACRSIVYKGIGAVGQATGVLWPVETKMHRSLAGAVLLFVRWRAGADFPVENRSASSCPFLRAEAPTH